MMHKFRLSMFTNNAIVTNIMHIVSSEANKSIQLKHPKFFEPRNAPSSPPHELVLKALRNLLLCYPYLKPTSFLTI
ncbi:hypothetical protein Fmac_029731 [Flemingia macrophylla]|uniref:Uncharacterized protein n=1 Tax=Flemingia macrophylla TaxID=520843 RepID=A0ABD1LB65_9FABA